MITTSCTSYHCDAWSRSNGSFFTSGCREHAGFALTAAVDMQLSIFDPSVSNIFCMSAVSSRSVYCKLQGVFSIIDTKESYLSLLCTYVTSEHCIQRIQSRLICCL